MRLTERKRHTSENSRVSEEKREEKKKENVKFVKEMCVSMCKLKFIIKVRDGSVCKRTYCTNM